MAISFTIDELASQKTFKARCRAADPQHCDQGEACDYDRLGDPCNPQRAFAAGAKLCWLHNQLVRLWANESNAA